MASLNDVITGLTIFAHHGGGHRHVISAEYDAIRAGQAEGEELSANELAALQQAGWFHDSETGCDCSGVETDEDGEETGHLAQHHLATCNDWIKFV